jgi:hypothetical protein
MKDFAIIAGIICSLVLAGIISCGLYLLIFVGIGAAISYGWHLFS